MLFAKYRDPKVIEKIKTDPFYAPFLEEVEFLYNDLCTTPLPALQYSKFMLFFRTGSRKEYERMFFQRRGRIDALFMRYLLYGREQDLRDLEDVIWAICDEYTWALPAHLTLEMTEDEKRTYIDLFAGETAQILAEVYTVLGEELSEQIRRRVEYEMERRIFSSFEDTQFFWEKAPMNWAAVCAGCVGMAFICMAPERFAGVRPRIFDAMDYFLSSYGDDGACQEGIGYWNYGFGYYVYFAQLLYEFDGTDLLHTEKVQKIVLFQQNAILRNDTVISFSDAGRTMRFQAGLTYFLKKLYPDTFQIPDMQYRSNMLQERGAYRFAAFTRLFFWTEPGYETGVMPDGMIYYGDAQWYVNKKKAYSFAAKGGHNDEPHNHNDLGSFIIATDAGQCLADIGSGEYTRDYFREKRYTYLCNASAGHSVPLIDGREQLAGRGRAAKVLEHGEHVFEISFEKGYGIEALTALRRRFELAEDSVSMRDSYQFDDGNTHQITERFIALIEPQETAAGVLVGDVLLVCKEKPAVNKIIIKDHNAEDLAVYQIDYAAGTEFEIQFQIRG